MHTLEGREFLLSDHRGAVGVLSFSSLRFPRAGQTIPALQLLGDYYRGQAVKVYWVSIDGAQAGTRDYVSAAALKTFVEQKGGRWRRHEHPNRGDQRSFGQTLKAPLLQSGNSQITW